MKARLRLGLLVAVAVTAMAFASSALGQNYVVLYKSQAVPADAAQTIAKAGGTLVYSYGQIGVAIASSDSASFRANLLKDNKIENASGTAGIRHPAHRQRRLVARCERASWRRPAERPGHRRRLAVAASVGHAADLHAGGARDHGRQPGRARRRHRHRASTSPIPTSSQNIDVADSVNCIERRAGPGARGAGRQRPWHAYRGHDRRSFERDRDRRSGAQRKDRRDQGRQFRGLLLPGSGRLRVHLGGDASRRRHEQQLLRRSVPVQLQERPRAAGDLEGRAAGDSLRPAAGRHGRGGRGQPERRPGSSDAGFDEPGQHDTRGAGDPQRLRRDSGRDLRGHRRHRGRKPASDAFGLPEVVLLELRRRQRAGRGARRRFALRDHGRSRRTAAFSRPGL